MGTKVILIGNIEEPFLDTHLIEKIEYTKEHNLKCFLITNGSRINEENAEQLVNLKLDYLNVSLNAGTPETYPRIHTTETQETFRRITSMVSLIEKIKEKKQTNLPRIRLSMVVCNRNYRDVVKFVELCQKTGAKDALIKRVINATKEITDELRINTWTRRKKLKQFLVEALKICKRTRYQFGHGMAEWMNSQENQVKENTPCYYGWLFSVIDADGNVYPCCFQDRNPSCAIGNIRKDDFSTIWFSRNTKTLEEISRILMREDK